MFYLFIHRKSTACKRLTKTGIKAIRISVLRYIKQAKAQMLLTVLSIYLLAKLFSRSIPVITSTHSVLYVI